MDVENALWVIFKFGAFLSWAEMSSCHTQYTASFFGRSMHDQWKLQSGNWIGGGRELLGWHLLLWALSSCTKNLKESVPCAATTTEFNLLMWSSSPCFIPHPSLIIKLFCPKFELITLDFLISDSFFGGKWRLITRLLWPRWMGKVREEEDACACMSN